MIYKAKKQSLRMTALACATILAALPWNARAHCDAVNGPVAVDARTALKNEDVGTVAIWVGEEQGDELKSAYKQALPVFKMGGRAGELAERYFMEAAVRLHRAAEGMPYDGLKPARPLPKDIAVAEKALQTGDLQPVTDLLAKELRRETEHYFQNALAAKEKYNGDSVARGRDWADAYVKYVIYVHKLHQTIQSGPAHGVGE